MDCKPDNNLSREERLAAKLRENLRRRKGQAREMAGDQAPGAGESGGDALPKPAEGG